MGDIFPKDEVETFGALFEETETYYNIRDMISMTLMPEEGIKGGKMPLYLVLNNKEEIKDVISAKVNSIVDGLNYGFAIHLVKLEKENIEQI